MARRLTAAAVEKIKPPAEGRVEHFDATLPGFALRVSSKGTKSWVLFYRQHGRQRRLTLGRYPALSLTEARELARQALHDIAKGGDPAEEKAKRTKRIETFADFSAEFIERHAKRHNKSWRETARIIERELIPYWGRRAAKEITRRDVIRALDRVVDRGSPTSANRLLAVTRKLFNWAVERSIVEASPCANIRAPAKESDRDRVLTDDEIRSLWTAFKEIGWPFGPFFKLLLVTAQRRSEVGVMRWADLDLVTRLWTLPREFTKADRRHEVPLSSLALKIIEGLPMLSDEDLVFTTHPEGHRPVSGFSQAKYRADKFSGVTDWRLHDLRRTAGTNMARLGVPVFTISRVLNHAQSGVTAIYDRYSYGEEKRQALDLWAEKLSEIIQPSS